MILDATGALAGEGATQAAGGPHAEVVALAGAGIRARGGTAVVTLEPCAHTGRTAPCADALVDAGVVRVVYAVDDINPVAAGGPTSYRAGVDVVAGSSITTKLPLARSAPGCTRCRPGAVRDLEDRHDRRRPDAAAGRTTRWISSEVSRADLMRSGRSRRDPRGQWHRAGGRSVVDRAGRADQLLEHQPLRVGLDRRHRVPQSVRVLDNAASTLVLDTAVPRFALKALHDQGVRHVLLEAARRSPEHSSRHVASTRSSLT